MPTAARNTQAQSGMWLCLFFGGHLVGTCISVGDERTLIGCLSGNGQAIERGNRYRVLVIMRLNPVVHPALWYPNYWFLLAINSGKFIHV
jgi:hypothetical protein